MSTVFTTPAWVARLSATFQSALEEPFATADDPAERHGAWQWTARSRENVPRWLVATVTPLSDDDDDPDAAPAGASVAAWQLTPDASTIVESTIAATRLPEVRDANHRENMLHRALALAVVKATAPDGSSSGPPNCRESAASTESRFTFELQGGPQAITAARIALMGIEFDEDIAFDVRLMTAELVANSVEHAHVDEADTMLLVVVVSASTVRVEVRDGGAGFSWPTTVPDPEARGWGLALIEQIAEAWGSDQERAAAWFEVRRCAQGRGDASTRLRDAG